MRTIAITAIAFAVLAPLAACDKAVEMKLIPPATSDVDTTCVTAIELTLTGRLTEEETYDCVEVDAGSVRSLQDNGLSGIFDLDLPPFDIIGVQVRGVAAAQGCTNGAAVGPTIFVASTDHVGDRIELPMRGVLSCADRVDQPAPVRIVDFQQLMTDGTCAPVEGLSAIPGELFPTMLYNNYNGYQWLSYFWAPPQTTPADGMMMFPYTFSQAATGSCLGLFYDDGSFRSDGCLTPAGRGACGPEAEFHYIPYGAARDATLSIEDQISHPSAVFGIVMDRQRRPIPGATITTATQNASVRFATPSGAGFTLNDGPSTDASGTFVVLANKPALIEVNKPGYATRRVMAGGQTATVVVMDAAAN
jgi:hypothetical protein